MVFAGGVRVANDAAHATQVALNLGGEPLDDPIAVGASAGAMSWRWNSWLHTSHAHVHARGPWPQARRAAQPSLPAQVRRRALEQEPSRTARISKISEMRSRFSPGTTTRRWASAVTRPSASRRRSASRTGTRDTPKWLRELDLVELLAVAELASDDRTAQRVGHFVGGGAPRGQRRQRPQRVHGAERYAGPGPLHDRLRSGKCIPETVGHTALLSRHREVPDGALGGRRVARGTGGGTVLVKNPATATPLVEVADATPKDAIAALDAACDRQAGWAAATPRERGRSCDAPTTR